MIAVFSMSILLSVDMIINPAYAVTGFQSYTQVDASAGTNDNCAGITRLPSTNYVVMVCRTPNNTSVRAFQSDGTVINTSTVSTTSNNVYQCFAVSSVTAVCQVSNINNEAGLVRITITSLTTITATTFINPCPVETYQLFGSSLFNLCDAAGGVLASGTVFRVSLSSFTQTGTWTGASGNQFLPLAQSGSSVKAISLSSGTIRLYSFTSTSSGAVSLLASNATSVATYATDNIYSYYAYDGVYLIYGRESTVGEYLRVTLGSSNTMGTATVLSQTFLDVKGVTPTSGSQAYWLFMGNNDQIYLYKKQSGVTPPNSFVGIQSVTVNTGSTLTRLGTHDSENFVISKGATTGANYWVFASSLHNENDNPVVNPPTGTDSGVDCTLEENAQKLICRLEAQGGQLPTFSDLVGQTFGNSTNNIFVQLGLVPAGSNIQTNGVGYGLTLVGLGIMISMFALASGMELNRIPTFVWFLGTLAVIGLSTGFGFVEPLWLIISILVIIALASAKILSTLEIGGFR